MPQQQSFLMWMIQALGIFGLIVPVLALAIFLGACVVVATSRRPAVIAAYLAFVPLPFVISVMGFLKGIVSSFSVIAMAGVTLKGSEIAGGVSESALVLYVGLISTLPSYLVVAIGLFVRTVTASEKAAG